MDGRHPIDRSIIVPFIIFTAIWGSTWIVIRDQLGVVPAQWSVAYRFLIAAAGMMAVARWQGLSLRLSPSLLRDAGVVGVAQFCANFNLVYLAEHHITSGLVATAFALLLIPNSLLAWAVLGQRPNARFFIAGAVAVVGIGLLFLHEWREAPVAAGGAILAGLGWTLAAMLSASFANVYQAAHHVRAHSLTVLLAWAMLLGAAIDVAIAFAVAGPPVFDPRPAYVAGVVYLALAASTLCFSLYFPVVRKIGPARAAYSSVMVPVIAMTLSTIFEGYRWSALAMAGAGLAIAGMLLALSWARPRVEELVAPSEAA